MANSDPYFSDDLDHFDRPELNRLAAEAEREAMREAVEAELAEVESDVERVVSRGFAAAVEAY